MVGPLRGGRGDSEPEEEKKILTKGKYKKEVWITT